MSALLFHVASQRVRRVRRKNCLKPLGLQLPLINFSACTSTIFIVVTLLGNSKWGFWLLTHEDKGVNFSF